jgi:hypothetical protein
MTKRRTGLMIVLKEFWRWCVTLNVMVFLDFVHHSLFQNWKSQRFGNWICFRLQMKEESRVIGSGDAESTWNVGHYLVYCTSTVPLWSSGQSSWLHIQRSGFVSRRYQIFWKVVGLERGPLSLVSTTEELLEIKSNGSGLEIREYCCKDPSRWPRGTLYPQKLALTSPTSGCRSVGVVHSRTQATEFSFSTSTGRWWWARSCWWND